MQTKEMTTQYKCVCVCVCVCFTHTHTCYDYKNSCLFSFVFMGLGLTNTPSVNPQPFEKRRISRMAWERLSTPLLLWQV